MEKKILEGDDLINVILQIPGGAVQIKCEVSMLDDGKVRTFETTFNNEDILAMRQAFLDNVEDGDDYDKVYFITEEGKKRLEGFAVT